MSAHCRPGAADLPQCRHTHSRTLLYQGLGSEQPRDVQTLVRVLRTGSASERAGAVLSTLAMDAPARAHAVRELVCMLDAETADVPTTTACAEEAACGDERIHTLGALRAVAVPGTAWLHGAVPSMDAAVLSALSAINAVAAIAARLAVEGVCSEERAVSLRSVGYATCVYMRVCVGG